MVVMNAATSVVSRSRLHDPQLGHAAAGDGDLRHLGRDQGRPQAELHHGHRLGPGHGSEAVPSFRATSSASVANF